VPLGRTQNMHRGYRFDVTEALRGGGTHELDVTLTAARRYAREVQEAVGTRPGAYAEPFQYIRKMACSFGWDWGDFLAPPDPRDTDDWHYLTQLNQARAVSYGVELFRSLHPVCTGTIVWQLNDCWPVTSWAAIDGDGRRKPLWYAVRRGFAQRLLTLQPRFRAPAAVLVNDGDATWVGTLDMTRRTP